MDQRPNYGSDDESFFVFKDKTPVKPEQMRNLLKELLKKAGFNENLYCCHGFRSGRAMNLMTRNKLSIETIKKLGHWLSNAVFAYLKTL